MPNPSKSEIQDQVALILGSAEFSSARRLSDFLEYIVSETQAGRESALQAYPVALEVFERTPDFDPQTDTIVRVQAGQLRLRLEKYYAQSGSRDRVLIRVPKGGYVPTFTERELQTKINPPVTEIGSSTPTIIVLPFESLSEDPSKEYFSLGLTEDIISALSCFPDIKIYSRNLTSLIHGSKADIIEVAKNPKVRFLLEGSVRHEQDKLRIVARVFNTETSTLLWSQVFNRQAIAAEIFDVENEIAIKVAAAIAGLSGDIARYDLLEAGRRPPETLSAYDAVLRAYGYWHNPDRHGHAEISTLLKTAVKNDPGYSDAAAMLSRMYLDQNRFGYNVETTVEGALEHSISFARQAIRCAPSNAVAWHLLSLAHFERREIELFEQAGERALSLCPNHPDILAQFGLQLWNLGQIKRGLEMVEKALALTPYPPGSYYFAHVHDDYLNGRDEQALRNALRLETNELFWMHFLQVAIYGQLGQIDNAQKAISRVIELNADFEHLSVEIFDWWTFPQTFKDRLIDGLKKAGFKFSDGTKGNSQIAAEQ